MSDDEQAFNPVNLQRRELLGAAALYGLLATSFPCKAQPGAAPRSFYASGLSTLKALRVSNPAINVSVLRVLARANSITQCPLLKRATSFAQLQNPSGSRLGAIDSRAYTEKANLFALAMADTSSTQLLYDELPLLAAAYVLTGDSAYSARITDQLTEVLTWKPLQRPGWSLYNGTADLPADGNDGVWLATGLGVAALVTTLQILPPEAIPKSLRKQVVEQISSEAKQIYADWRRSISWFVRDNKAVSNQWIVVASALVIAGSFTNQIQGDPLYEFGVQRVLQSLNAFGDEGAVSEGVIYGLNWDAPFLFLAARAASDIGDDRLQVHPFIRTFPIWLSKQFQPGISLVNCFDTYTGARGCYSLMAGNMSLVATLSQNPELLWIKQKFFGGPLQSIDFFGLLWLGVMSAPDKEPSLWGKYKRGALVVWRSSWDDDASGVWMRGGHALDSHDHNDRGHVNFIAHGKIVLMEAGTPTYSDPEIASMFQSVQGHNVLQVGNNLYPAKVAADIMVRSVNERGGSVEINAGAGYRGVKKWLRKIEWTADRMEIEDEVVLSGPEMILFRWHLGSEQTLSISNANEIFAYLPPGQIVFPGWIGDVPPNVSWIPPKNDSVLTPEVKMTIAANQPIVGSQESDRDHTMKYRFWKHRHTVLVVSTLSPIPAISIKTVVAAK
jgi:hypothetical protein